MRMDLDGLDKTPPSRPATFNAKGKNGPCPSWEISLGALVVRAIGQAWVTHPGHKTVLVQPCGNGHGVLHMALHTQGQRLQALQKQEGVKGAETGTEIAHHFHTRFHDKGKIAKRFPVAHAVVAWRRLDHFWEDAIVPGKSPAIDDDATDAGAVSANEFRGRVHDDVRPMLAGPAQVGRGKGIINNEWELMLVRNVRHSLDVEHVSLGIADSLPIEEFGFRRDSATKILRISRIDKVHLNAKAPKRQGKLIVRTAIEGARRHHLIPRLQQRRESDELRSLSGGRG